MAAAAGELMSIETDESRVCVCACSCAWAAASAAACAAAAAVFSVPTCVPPDEIAATAAAAAVRLLKEGRRWCSDDMGEAVAVGCTESDARRPRAGGVSECAGSGDHCCWEAKNWSDDAGGTTASSQFVDSASPISCDSTSCNGNWRRAEGTKGRIENAANECRRCPEPPGEALG